MKKNKSVTKKIVSMTAGGVLLASLYANAVYVPQNNQAVEQELDQQAQSILAGQVEFVADADGFKVSERPVAQPTAAVVDEVAVLVEAIKKLEAEVESQATVTTVESDVVRAAYSSGKVKQTAQTQAELEEVARQVSALSGLPRGATIGSLAAIMSNPFLSSAVAQLVTASQAPGGIAAAVSNGGGISSGSQTVLALLGVQATGGVAGGAAGGLGGGVGAAASAAAGGSAAAPSSP